jgi:ferredoxin
MTFLVSVLAEGSPTVQSKQKGLVGCVPHYKDAMPGRFCAICVAVHALAYMGCGVCISVCLQDALRLVRDPSHGEPLEIRNLIDNRLDPGYNGILRAK